MERVGNTDNGSSIEKFFLASNFVGIIQRDLRLNTVVKEMLGLSNLESISADMIVLIEGDEEYTFNLMAKVDALVTPGIKRGIQRLEFTQLRLLIVDFLRITIMGDTYLYNQKNAFFPRQGFIDDVIPEFINITQDSLLFDVSGGNCYEIIKPHNNIGVIVSSVEDEMGKISYMSLAPKYSAEQFDLLEVVLPGRKDLGLFK